MEKYIRKERLMEILCIGLDKAGDVEKLNDILNKLSVEIVTPAVRCRDCIHASKNGDGVYVCEAFRTCDRDVRVNPDEFCSRGVKKE